MGGGREGQVFYYWMGSRSRSAECTALLTVHNEILMTRHCWCLLVQNTGLGTRSICKFTPHQNLPGWENHNCLSNRGGFNLLTEQRSAQWECCWGIFINNKDGRLWSVLRAVALIGCRSIQSRPESFRSTPVWKRPSEIENELRASRLIHILQLVWRCQATNTYSRCGDT